MSRPSPRSNPGANPREVRRTNHRPSGRRARAAVVLTAAAALGIAGLSGVAAAPATAATPSYLADPASMVDPLIGTSGAVDDFPGADAPFGMVQWSPDTPSRPSGGGYEYTDKTVTGFSLDHISGPGCGAAGDIPVLPTSGAVSGSPSDASLPLDHDTESATAGQYSLTAGGITTDLTATTRSGMARFTFPADAPANLLFKLSGSANGTSSTHFQVVNGHEVSGWVTSGHFCGASDTYNVYFDMVFDRPFSSNGTWQDGDDIARGADVQTLRKTTKPTAGDAAGTEQARSSNGVARQRPHLHGTSAGTSRTTPQAKAATPPVSGAAGAYLTFAPSAQPVQAKVGLSYVSVAGAKGNRTSENTGWDFAGTAQHTHDAWNTLLNKAQIAGGTTDQQRVYETALYHSLLHPNVFSDSDGQYMGFDGQVHTAPKGHAEYANYSGWDIYRSQVQLAAMLAPKQTSDSIRSMLDDYDQTGELPKWNFNGGETYVMVGDPADPIIADAYAFGARDFDTAHALKAMQYEANQPGDVRPGLDYYEKDGYLPLDGNYGCCNFYGPVSTQQEYNTADHAIASFATMIGKSKVAAPYAQRANNWQNVFNPATGYLQAKYADGRYATGFTPSTSNGFVEGTSAQYTPMEPFDIAGLAAADGGNANWIAKLDSLTSKIKSPGPENADFGNEPSIEIPWEYDYVGAPYKTQKTVRDIQQQIFPAAPAGIAGNDDLGAMSAWYVFSALGFYPETPGTADLALGSAVFPKARVHLASGKTLTITAPDAATASPYVQSMTVNDEGWAHAYLPSSLVTKGGTVDEDLSSTPDTSFGSAPKDAPPSDRSGLASALGYVDGTTEVVTPGSTGTLTIGAQNLHASKQNVSWTASSTDGLGVSPASGTLRLPASGKQSQQLTLTAPTKEGRYTVTVDYRSATGASLPSVTTEVDVAKPGELWPFYNNAGIASDGTSGASNFDGDGYAYSEQQLAAQGLGSGKSKTLDGIGYTMPDTQPGDLDNIEAGGQTIPVAATGATRIGVLGSSTNGDPGASTTVTVHYADGTSQQVSLGLTDWTLVGGAAKTPSYGNTVAATTDYRDTTGGDKQSVPTYLFAADAALSGSGDVTSITLPASTDEGQFHVFAIGTA